MTNPLRKLLIGLAGVAIILISLTACGDKYNEPFKDAPRSGNDGSPALTVEMPDGFSNVATKCITGTDIRITVAYHGDNHYAAISTVVDPQCAR